jgi:hypothetical protein
LSTFSFHKVLHEHTKNHKLIVFFPLGTEGNMIPPAWQAKHWAPLGFH